MTGRPRFINRLLHVGARRIDAETYIRRQFGYGLVIGGTRLAKPFDEKSDACRLSRLALACIG